MIVQGEEHPGSHGQGQQPPSHLGQLQTQGIRRGGAMPTSHSQTGWEVGHKLVLNCAHLHQGAA